MYGGVYVAKDVGLVVRSAPAVPTPPPVLSAPARCSHRHLAPSRLPPTSQPAPRPVSHQCPPSLLMTWHRTRGPSLTKSATSTVRTCGTSTRSARSVSRPRAPATAPRGTWTTCDASMAVVRSSTVHMQHASTMHGHARTTRLYTHMCIPHVHTARAHTHTTCTDTPSSTLIIHTTYTHTCTCACTCKRACLAHYRTCTSWRARVLAWPTRALACRSRSVQGALQHISLSARSHQGMAPPAPPHGAPCEAPSRLAGAHTQRSITVSCTCCVPSAYQ